MSVNHEHIDAVEAWLRELHDGLTEGIERLDGGGRFRRDTWQRPEGGRVFNVGSIAAGWALPADPKLQTLLRNVLANFEVPRLGGP